MVDDLILTIINNNGIDVTDSRDVAKMVGKAHNTLMRDIRVLLYRNPEYSYCFIKSTYKDSQNKIQPCYLMSEKGKNTLIEKSKLRMQSASLEIKFIDGLEKALEPFNIKGIRQYSVDKYRIDYYIPSLNIAIEYDEDGHKGYSYEAHEGRQAYIEEKLGCRFIRITDENDNYYNIGYVIKNMFTNFSYLINEKVNKQGDGKCE